MSDSLEMAERLRAFLTDQLVDPANLTIRNLTRTTGGQSRENWPFDATWQDRTGDHDEALILRRDPIGSVLETDRRVEHDVLVAVEADPDIPSPRSGWLDAEGRFLGRPSVVMRRYDGVCDHFVLEGGSLQLPLEDRVQLAYRYCGIMAAIHRFDWRSSNLRDLLEQPRKPAVTAIDHWSDVLGRQAVEPHPELVAVECWLRANPPDPEALVLVHGDLKPGNSLLHQQEGRWDVHVMLDWETVHLGDPLEDVGWVTNPLRQREHLIPGAWERRDLLSHYESLTGWRADAAAVHFWNVLANYKLAVITLTGVRSFIDGRSERAWSCSRSLAGYLLRQIETGPLS